MLIDITSDLTQPAPVATSCYIAPDAVACPKFAVTIIGLLRKHGIAQAKPGQSLRLRQQGYPDLLIKVLNASDISVSQVSLWPDGTDKLECEFVFWAGLGANWFPIEETTSLTGYKILASVFCDNNKTSGISRVNLNHKATAQFIEELFTVNLTQANWLGRGVPVTSED